MFHLLKSARSNGLYKVIRANLSNHIKHNFSKESEDIINKQINIELYSAYVYQSMFIYFNRADVALPGFAKYFQKNAQEELSHAEKLMLYMNKRGGLVKFDDIPKPPKNEWGSPSDALHAALKVEKNVNQAFLDMHKISSLQNDPHFSSFIEDEFLDEQVESIYEISSKLTELKTAGLKLGEEFVDRTMHEDSISGGDAKNS